MVGEQEGMVFHEVMETPYPVGVAFFQEVLNGEVVDLHVGKLYINFLTSLAISYLMSLNLWPELLLNYVARATPQFVARAAP